MERTLDGFVDAPHLIGFAAVQEGAQNTQMLAGLGPEDVEQFLVYSEQTVVIDHLLGGGRCRRRWAGLRCGLGSLGQRFGADTVAQSGGELHMGCDVKRSALGLRLDQIGQDAHRLGDTVQDLRGGRTLGLDEPVEQELYGLSEIADLERADQSPTALEGMETAAQRGQGLGVGRIGLPARQLDAGRVDLLARLFQEDVQEFGLAVIGFQIQLVGRTCRFRLRFERRFEFRLVALDFDDRLGGGRQFAQFGLERRDGATGAVDQGVAERHRLLEMADIQFQSGDGIGQMVDLGVGRETPVVYIGRLHQTRDQLGQIGGRVFTEESQGA
jgi:hypothetical protein